jgi:superfamily II DNA or RNA helicase
MPALVLDVPYDQRDLAAAHGAVWSREAGHVLQVPDGQAPPATLIPYLSAACSWERWQEAALNDVPAARRAGYLAGPHPAVADHRPPPVPMAARPHQHAGAQAIVAAREAGLPGFLLADEVGLGKTLTALHALLAMPDIRTVLIICPLSVVAHWRRTLAAVDLDGRCAVVVNYDRLRRLVAAPASATAARRTRTRNRRTAAGGRPLLAADAVICDEAHHLRNPTTQRAQLVARLRGPAFTLWLSATAGQSAQELSYAAPLLDALTGSTAPVKDIDGFAAWCRDQGLLDEPGVAGAPSADRLRELLFTPQLAPGVSAGLRRRPQDLAGWPEIDRSLLPIALDAAQRVLYASAWTVFRAELDLAGRGRNSLRGRAAQLRFRQKTSLLKIEGTAELVADLLADERQVIVSVAFRETAALLDAALQRRRIAATVVDGSTTGPEREERRLAFQRGDVPVVVTTLTEGISLHAEEQLADGSPATATPRVTLLHDPRYTGYELAQVEGRGHRDGQYCPIFYCVAEDTVETEIMSGALGRRARMGRLHGDDAAAVDQLDALEAALHARAGAEPLTDGDLAGLPEQDRTALAQARTA